MPLGNLQERSLEVGRRGDYLCLCTLENPSPSYQFIFPSEGKEETSASGPKVGWKE